MDLDINNIITDNFLTQNKSLDLSGCRLNAIPEEIFELSHLTELKLMNNDIDFLSEDISKLSNLTHLYLYQNNIIDIPFNALAEMRFLECIDLGENPIVAHNLNKISRLYEKLEKEWQCYRMLVNDIRRDKDARLIYFTGYLPELPPEILELKKLKSLLIDKTRLKRIPEEIYQLENLESIHITDAEINFLPRNILSLKNLKSINLDFNKFTEFPEVLLDHPSLSSISMNGNLITQIKPYLDEIVLNDKIVSFSFANNPLEDFKEELFRENLSFIKRIVYSINEEE